MRRLILALVLAAAAGHAAGGLAQTYPSRPIAMIVPLPAGGAVDVLARMMAEGMRASLGQPIVVENISGAGGTLATGRVVRSAPDGYTLGIGTSVQYVMNGALYPLAYDLVKDFEPIALLPTVPYWIIAKKEMPANNLAEMIAWLKANPDKASAGIVGVGGSGHLCLINLQNATGTRFQFVPYRGGAPELQDLLGGQIDLSCDLAANSLPMVRAGRIKAFAVMTKTRWFAAPDVPTADEAGVGGIYVSNWIGLWAPRATPRDIIAKLNAAVVAAMADPILRGKIAEQGMEIPAPDQQIPEALGAYQKAEIEKWWPIIKAAGVKPE
jgi:tripartite-type tricarboxylate transporter receptor subunit TctC